MKDGQDLIVMIKLVSVIAQITDFVKKASATVIQDSQVKNVNLLNAQIYVIIMVYAIVTEDALASLDIKEILVMT